MATVGQAGYNAAESDGSSAAEYVMVAADGTLAMISDESDGVSVLKLTKPPAIVQSGATTATTKPAAPPPMLPTSNPSPPPPFPGIPGAEPVEVISFALVVAGTVESFDQLAFIKSLAKELAVPEEDIFVLVAAASLSVTAQVKAPADATQRNATLTSMQTITANPTIATTKLGVTVEKIAAAPIVETVVASGKEVNGTRGGNAGGLPFGAAIPTTGASTGVLVGGIVGGIVGIIVIAVAARLIMKKRFKTTGAKVAPPPSSSES